MKTKHHQRRIIAAAIRKLGSILAPETLHKRGSKKKGSLVWQS